MKKFLAIIATVALFAIILSSCKSHELCPAYGKVGKVKSYSNAELKIDVKKAEKPV